MSTVICTTGTSVAQGIPFSQIDRNSIDERLRALREKEPDNYVIRASAESNSLSRMKLDHNDRVYLLHTETEDGRICADAVKRLISGSLGLDNVTLCEVAGLQVTDGNRFRRDGVNKLFEILDRICRPHLDRQQRDVWLNITGGFKSVVPYVTLFGQLYRLPVVYVFERSESLITLPPAAINFDFERLARAADAIHALTEDGAMTEDEFFGLIPKTNYSERDWFSALLEKDDRGYVTLSAFGLLALRVVQEDEAATVYLSSSAGGAYDDAVGDVRDQFKNMLIRVRNPLWRRLKDHAFHGTDLKVASPGDTGQRMAYYMQNSQVYVCEMFPTHDSYERNLPGKMRAHYAAGSWTPHV